MSDGASLYNVSARPLHDWILVRMIDTSSRKTPGGLYIPDAAESAPVAQIVKVGPGTPNYPIKDLSPGDLVILQKYTGNKLLINDQVHLLVRYQEVQSVLTYYTPDGIQIIPDVPKDAFLSDNKPKPSLIQEG